MKTRTLEEHTRSSTSWLLAAAHSSSFPDHDSERVRKWFRVIENHWPVEGAAFTEQVDGHSMKKTDRVEIASHHSSRKGG